MFEEELITWSIDGGGRPFHRKKHKYSVTNVCGFLRIKNSNQWNYKYVHSLLEKQHNELKFDYQLKAHPSVIKKIYKLRKIPLLEQQAIAAFLDTIDEAIATTTAHIEKLKLAKAGLLHDLLTHGMDEDGNLRDPINHPNQFKNSELGLIPKAWNIETTEQAAAPISGSTTIGPFGSNLVMSDYRSEGIPVVFVRDIKPSLFQWKSEVYVTFEKASELSAHSVKPGDLIATKMGEPPCVSCVYPDWMPPGVITADIIRLTPNLQKTTAQWLSMFINTETVARQVRGITGGVTRAKVTLKDFRNLRVALPKLEEQTRILNALQDFEQQIHSKERKASKFKLLKQGLMSDLLTGRVRVEVDSSEES